MEWIEPGYWGLFLTTFLAATVLPFSSELILAGMLVTGFDPGTCLVIATAGNWLGGMSSYGLGWIADWQRLDRWLGIREADLLRWKQRIDRYGVWAALLCWVPFIGDPIAVALGLFRTNWWLVSLLMLAGKAIRYAVVIGVIT